MTFFPNYDKQTQYEMVLPHLSSEDASRSIAHGPRINVIFTVEQKQISITGRAINLSSIQIGHKMGRAPSTCKSFYA
jgi:hypothetical protein